MTSNFNKIAQNHQPISLTKASNYNRHFSGFSKLTDGDLYQLCKTYGGRALLWRQKFIGLLPEVFKRKLFEKKGFSSVFEFAKKLAGLSEDQVRLTLNLEKRFEEMPALKSLLVNGEVSVNKLARVVSIANTENEIFLANQVQILSNAAVETLVRDEKFMVQNQSCNYVPECRGAKYSANQDGLFEPRVEVRSLHVQTLPNDRNVLNLSPEIQQKLLDLQQKGFDINALLLEFLQKREIEIAQEKEQIAEKVLQKEEVKKLASETIGAGVMEKVVGDKSAVTRYIPQAVKNILTKEFGNKCSIRNCQKLANQIHHTQRFSLSQSHDPHYLAPLCREHHELAHTTDVSYYEIRRQTCARAL